MEILNYHVSDGQSGIRIDRYLSEKNEKIITILYSETA